MIIMMLSAHAFLKMHLRKSQMNQEKQISTEWIRAASKRQVHRGRRNGHLQLCNIIMILFLDESFSKCWLLTPTPTRLTHEEDKLVTPL